MVICITTIHLPSPEDWQYQSAYDYVLGNLPRIFVGSVFGVFVGAFVNTYLIVKWKILVRGKYFWLRSIASSGIGQLVFTMITLSYDLTGIVPFNQVIHLILVSFTIKLVLTPLLAIPSTVLVYYLKKLENIDVYDFDTNFNPFALNKG